MYRTIIIYTTKQNPYFIFIFRTVVVTSSFFPNELHGADEFFSAYGTVNVPYIHTSHYSSVCLLGAITVDPLHQ